MTTTTNVCSHCGSSHVFYDAWVGVNDPSDVRTFDATFCMACEGPTSLIPVPVPTDDALHDTLVDLYERGGHEAVCEWVLQHRPDWPWSRCTACDAHTPTWDGACSVCFTDR